MFYFCFCSILYFTLHIPWNLISFLKKTSLLKRSGNNWSPCHSMYFLIFCSKFFDSALNNSYSFFLLHFFLWLQNKGIFGKAPVLCDGFGDFMDDLQNRVGTICFSELWMLISQDCPSSCSAFSVFPRRTVERPQIFWYLMADSILTGNLTSEYFKFWICLALKTRFQGIAIKQSNGICVNI